MPKFAFILFAFWVNQAFTQTPAYLHYDVRDGLPSSLVYCMTQDSRGLLWFGTDKGLARFDGTRFRVFNMKDGLPDPEVFNIFEDSQGRLWLSCFRKKPCYFKDGKFVTAEEDELLDKIDMEGGTFTFFEDKKGAIWIADRTDNYCKFTSSGLTSFNAPYTIYQFDTIENELFAFGIWGILKVQENGSLQPDSEIPNDLFSIPEMQYKMLLSGLDKKNLPPHFSLSVPFHVSLAISGHSVLYGYPQGLILLERKGGSFKEVDRSMGLAAGSISVDIDGRFWILSQTKGAIGFDYKRAALRDPQIFMIGKKVSHVFQDKTKTHWFTTLNDGVYALPENAVVTFVVKDGEPFISNNFMALSRLTNGTLVVGDDSGNLYFYINNHWKIKQLGSVDGYNLVRKILPMENNQWIAVSDEWAVSSSSGSLNANKPEGAYKTIFKNAGKYWLGTSHHLINWKDDYSKSQVILHDRITAIGADAENNIWIGRLNGLFTPRDSFSNKWRVRFPQLASRIVAIQKGEGNTLWVVTPEYGLLRVYVEKGEIQRVEEMNNLFSKPIENIQSLFVEENGTVWLATNNGVYSFDKNLTVSHLGEKDGLADDDVNAVLVHNDTLWVATASGLSRIQLQPTGTGSDFATYITGIRYRDGEQKVFFDLLDMFQLHEEIVLPANTSLLEIEMTGLQFRSRGNLHYELETAESLLPVAYLTWRNLGKWLANGFTCKSDTAIVENAVQNYGVNVPPGRYHIKATAMIPGGVKSRHPDERTFIVLPQWTETVWFSLVIISFFSYAIWRLYKARVAFQQLKSAASELQLQAIKAQINPHFVGNSINAIQQFFYPPDPVKASRYISIFSDLLRRTMYLSEQDFIHFQDELNYLQAYLEMIRLRFGERFQFSIKGTKKVPLEMPFPSMVLQPIIENATIHGMAPSGVSQLKINFAFEGKKFLCSITDNGVGIDKSRERKKSLGSKRPSKGLLLLEKKIQMLNRLQPLELEFDIRPLSEINPALCGTQATISFYPDNIRHEKLYPPNSQPI